MNKKAEMGVGTLILFIAMILVAGITASVLIQTGTSLQDQALSTAKSAQRSVSTKVEIIHITAEDGSEGNLNNFEEEIRLVPGSEGIKLEDALLTIDLSDDSASLVYSSEACLNVSDSSGDGYFTDSTNGNGTFTVKYLKSSDSHTIDYLLKGEIIKLCFSTPRSVGEDESLSFRFIPKYASSTSVEFLTPSVITTQLVQVYP